MRPLFECNVCYDSTYHVIHCFNDCSFKVCRDCFKKMIVLKNSEVCYGCPMCRKDSTYMTTKRFTNFVNKSIDLLRIVVELTYKQFRTNHQWDNFLYEQFPIFQAYMEDQAYHSENRGITILPP